MTDLRGSGPRLLALRLQGFKTFAERTVVEFGPGISAVVGPNGSGKSNLADALRWTLGEQGRALRSRKSEDVIFAGSERRAALGMADVTLVLDNSDGLLPVEFSVLELGRRLYRSGENEYLLNRQRVRLKDLVDLLDAAHLADNAFLFIGQGMVDQALAMRPEERRPLFEEVAGVRRHERRRRHAEEQLAEAEANLARVEDILAELRPQARRLAAQAEQQATRESAGNDLAAALTLTAHARWHAAAIRAREATTRLTRARAEMDRELAGLAAAESVMATLRHDLAERATEERARRANLDAAQASLTAARIEQARLAGEAAALDRDEARLSAERDEATTRLEDRRRQLALPGSERNLELENSLASAERALADAIEDMAALGAARDTRGEAVRAERRARAAREAELAEARRRFADASEHAARELAEAERAGSRREELAAGFAGAQTELGAAIDAERSAAADRAALRPAVETADLAARAAADRASELGGRAANLRGRVEALAGLRRADDSGGLARIARRRGGRRIDEGLSIDPELRPAVEAILGDAARAHVVPRDSVIALAGERGVAVVQSSEGPVGAALAEGAAEGVADHADDSVATRALLARVSDLGGSRLVLAVHEDPTGAARRLVASSVWVPDLEALIAIQPSLLPGWRAVTRDGSAVIDGAVVRLGPPAGALERAAESERLSDELAAMQAALAEAAAAAAERAASAEVLRGRLGEAVASEERAAAARRHAEDRERAAGRALETIAREGTWHAAQAQRLSQEVQRLRAILDELEADVALEAASAGSEATPDEASATARLEARVGDLRARRDRFAADAAAADLARRDAQARRVAAEVSLAMDEERLARTAREEAAVAERRLAISTETDAALAQLAGAEAQEAHARTLLDALLESDDADRSRLAQAEAVGLDARARLRSAEDRSRVAEAEDLEARVALDGVREQVLVELAGLGEVGLRALLQVAGPHDEGDVIVNAWARPSPPREADEPGEDVEADIFESALEAAARHWVAEPPGAAPPATARLTLLRRRYHELGAPNPYAAGEYGEIRSRLDSLETQERDLRDAIRATRSLIADLGALIATQFQATFRALEGAFDARFRQLFGGGYAHLRLTDPADLSATGVEIVARPPGKKPQSLTMLSGGERALTAVALLFAMLEVRPVPFCVLDEVDAALDESNIGRFAEALQGLAATTQFVVITHNRGTIEAADALYGITVGDDSVSRVVSLRLDEATALAERDRRGRDQEPELAAAG